jgi:hypothetical protein
LQSVTGMFPAIHLQAGWMDRYNPTECNGLKTNRTVKGKDVLSSKVKRRKA